MTNIKVQKTSEDKETLTFSIDITEGNTKTNHTVELDKPYYERLTGGRATAEELVEKSFIFLLKREPKESILGEFNLKMISYYFPEYENEIRNYF